MSGLALYTIADQYLHTLRQLEETDLPAEVVRDTLEGMGGELMVKGAAVASYFLNLEAEAAAIREAEKRMADRRKRIEARVQQMKDYLQENMERCGITEIKAPEFRLAIQKKRPSVEVVDMDALPAEFKRIKYVEEAEKTELYKALSAGKEIPGARLGNDTTKLKIE